MWVEVGCLMWRCHMASPFVGLRMGDAVGARLDPARGLREEALSDCKLTGAQRRRCEDPRP